MTRTPDDVKKGLEHCSEDGCKKCPYEDDCNMADCFSVLAGDALALIQQLEAQNAELLENIKWMEAERDDFKRTIRQLEAERDAAVADILYAASVYLGECNTCKNGEVCAACKRQDACDECPNSKCMCSGCGAGRSNWQWRGVTKEE